MMINANPMNAPKVTDPTTANPCEGPLRSWSNPTASSGIAMQIGSGFHRGDDTARATGIAAIMRIKSLAKTRLVTTDSPNVLAVLRRRAAPSAATAGQADKRRAR